MLQRVHCENLHILFLVCFLKNYQALTNEKDIHLKIKATGGKLCYLDLSIMLSVFVFLQKHVKKEFFFKKKKKKKKKDLKILKS